MTDESSFDDQGFALDEGHPSGLNVPVTFTPQPHPIEARHRIAYRSAVLVLILGSFRTNTATLDHLHLISWSLRTSRTRAMFLSWWSGRSYIGTSVTRIDPGMQVTVNLAIADDLIAFSAQSGASLKLLEKGLKLLGRIDADEELLKTEKSLLSVVRPLTNAELDRRMGRVGQ